MVVELDGDVERAVAGVVVDERLKVVFDASRLKSRLCGQRM